MNLHLCLSKSFNSSTNRYLKSLAAANLKTVFPSKDKSKVKFIEEFNQSWKDWNKTCQFCWQTTGAFAYLFFSTRGKWALLNWNEAIEILFYSDE